MDVSRRTVIAGTAAGAVAAGVLSTLGRAAHVPHPTGTWWAVAAPT